RPVGIESAGGFAGLMKDQHERSTLRFPHHGQLHRPIGGNDEAVVARPSEVAPFWSLQANAPRLVIPGFRAWMGIPPGPRPPPVGTPRAFWIPDPLLRCPCTAAPVRGRTLQSS